MLARGSSPVRIWIIAALKVLWLIPIVPGCEKCVELAVVLKLIQVVAAADMHFADKNLRHGHAAIGALDHQLALRTIAGNVDLGELDALLGQQRLGAVAIGQKRVV